ncbi:flagellar hook-associated protein 3 FlgL [Pelagirhabdus alkalitolerans]|uniref:Flagellar hook-associated protein 3 FlgL n=1 Tax=Pelagirhabdus alkalitolerans TaxID=1612202 RepID=A0A1G6L4N2_9BACI|nr:flagellar hook-associated protein FlgL [Pelagirhabdus alkalitolerans]SDC38250.1 flagellar hook-associated protein 3 FlgL [Pelagirhabdus alkalitolerans]
MRVTQNMLTKNMLNNVSKSNQSMGKYMDQLSTGKKINRPSDDPVVAMKGMGYRTEVSNVEQYERNITEMYTWMDSSDDSLNETTQILNRVRELAVQTSNGTYDNEQLANVAKEVDQLKEQLAEVANTRVNNKYIFNGTKTTGTEDGNGDLQPPVVVDNNGNVTVNEPQDGYNDVMMELTPGTKMRANVQPDNVFSQEMFDDITAFSNRLKGIDEDGNEIPEGDLENIDQFITSVEGHIDNSVSERADLGARMNRVELIEDRIGNQSISAKRLMSNNEDADMAEVIMNLTSQEVVHRSALSAGARIIQPTLMDFLR